MRGVLETAADADVAPEILDQIGYMIATMSDGYAINWLTYADREQAAQQAEVVIGVLDAWLATKLG